MYGISFLNLVPLCGRLLDIVDGCVCVARCVILLCMGGLCCDERFFFWLV